MSENKNFKEAKEDKETSKDNNETKENKKRTRKASSLTMLKNPKFLNTAVFEKRELDLIEEERKRKFQRTLPQIQTEASTKYKTLTKTKWSNNPKSLYLTDVTFSTANQTNQTDKDKIDIKLEQKILKEENYGHGYLAFLSERSKFFPTEEQTKENLLKRKNRTINIKKEGVKEYIDKTRDIIAIKYNTDIKKERAIRLKETYSNEIESINDTINSLKEAKKLFNEEFYSKFGEYVKHLLKQKEHEITASLKLDEKRQILYKQTTNLYQQENRKKSELERIFKWLALMIKVKEKILVLPDDLHTIFTKLKEAYKKDSKKNRDSKEYRLTEEEKAKLEKYKKNLIFKEPEDFIYEFSIIQDLNMETMDKYNQTKLNQKMLMKNLEELKEEEQMIMKNYTTIINQKKTECELLKERNKFLRSEKEKYAPTRSKIRRKTNLDTKAKQKSKKNEALAKVIKKVEILFQSALLFYKDKELEHIKDTTKDLVKGEQSLEKLDLVLHKLNVVELTMGKLDVAFKMHKINIKDCDEKISKIRKKIDKEHKREKNEKQKEEQRRKAAILNQQVTERANKIYFIPLRKTNAYENFGLNKKEEDSKKNTKETEPQFYDFMYDLEFKENI